MPDDARDEHRDSERRRDSQDGADINPFYHGPPEDRIEEPSASHDDGEPTAHKQPHRATPMKCADHRGGPGSEKQQFYERAYWAVTGAASVCATIATVVAAIYAVSAYRASLEAVRETRAQVQVARDANEISSRALVASVSSLVYFGEVGIRMVTSAQQAIKVNIIAPIGNGGGTTTRGLLYTGNCTDTADPVNAVIDFGRLNAMQAHHITLAPKQTANAVVCSYTLDRWRSMIANGESVFLYGQVSCRDTVDPAVVHRSQFCGRLYDLGFTVGPFNPGAFATGEECPHHNCADDECSAG